MKHIHTISQERPRVTKAGSLLAKAQIIENIFAATSIFVNLTVGAQGIAVAAQEAIDALTKTDNFDNN